MKILMLTKLNLAHGVAHNTVVRRVVVFLYLKLYSLL